MIRGFASLDHKLKKNYQLWASDCLACGFAIFSIYILKPYLMSVPEIVEFQKISILLPQKGLEFPGGFYKAKKFKEMYEA